MIILFKFTNIRWTIHRELKQRRRKRRSRKLRTNFRLINQMTLCRTRGIRLWLNLMSCIKGKSLLKRWNKSLENFHMKKYPSSVLKWMTKLLEMRCRLTQLF